MIHQIIDIKVDYKAAGIDGKGSPKLYTYIIDHSPEMDYHKARPAVIICPGGGYAMTSDREAEPVALRFNSLGFQAFVLRYSVMKVRFPGALLNWQRLSRRFAKTPGNGISTPTKSWCAAFGGRAPCGRAWGYFGTAILSKDRWGIRAGNQAEWDNPFLSGD